MAQWLAQSAYIRSVPGSSPGWPTYAKDTAGKPTLQVKVKSDKFVKLRINDRMSNDEE